MNKPRTFLCFDLDGTLVPRNQLTVKPTYLINILNRLGDFGHFVIPVTGKPVEYAQKIFPLNQLVDHGLIAENAGVYRCPDSNTINIFGPSLDQLTSLRKAIGVNFDKTNVTKILLQDKLFEVVVDPDDRSILTIFTDPSFVAHRWTFQQSISAEDLVNELEQIINKIGLDSYVSVLPPFPDGGVQVVRKDPVTGDPVDKSALTQVLKSMFPQVNHPKIVMFGDGHNDIPAMSASGVIGLTFANAHPEVKAFVASHEGYNSSENAPDGDGILDGLNWLNKKGFFDQDAAVTKLLS